MPTCAATKEHMEKKKLLFLHPYPSVNKRFFVSKTMHLGVNQGLGILIQIAIDRNHDVETLAYSSIHELNKILKNSYDWIFISTFTNQFPLISRSLKLFREKMPFSKIVIGGVHASFAPEHFANCPYDYLVRGEGEIFLMDLLDDKDFASLPGVFAKSQKITAEFAPMVTNLDSIPAPSRYLTSRQCHNRLHVIGHRGCNFRCPYCVGQQYKRSYDKYMRWRSPEKIIKEIEAAMAKERFSQVRFDDSIFFGNQEWLKELTSLYKERIKLKFSINIRPAFVTKKTLRMFKKAGCFLLSIGVEHGNYQFRKELLRRYETDEQIIESFKLAKFMGIKTLAYNILGFPDDTEADILKLIELNKKACPTFIHHTLFQPYPGTLLAAYAKTKKINYKFSNSYFLLDSSKKYFLPSLPGISKEKLRYYLINFIKLAKNRQYIGRLGSFFSPMLNR